MSNSNNTLDNISKDACPMEKWKWFVGKMNKRERFYGVLMLITLVLVIFNKMRLISVALTAYFGKESLARHLNRENFDIMVRPCFKKALLFLMERYA